MDENQVPIDPTIIPPMPRLIAPEGVGTIIFRPLEIKLPQDINSTKVINPYCKFGVGWHSGKSPTAVDEGTHLVWDNESVMVERTNDKTMAQLKVIDKNQPFFRDNIGETKIPLDELIKKRKVTEWVNLYNKDAVTGEILIDMEFHPRQLV